MNHLKCSVRPRLWGLFLVITLCSLIFTGCSPSASPPPSSGYTLEEVAPLLEAPVWGSDLEELDLDMAWQLYDLEAGGISQDALTDGLIRRSAGSTCEELALLIFSDDSAAQSAYQQLQRYLEHQIQSNLDYRPQELPKLESALLQQQGNTVLFAVSQNSETLQDLLN